ncbi:hypothetical protein Unana1_01174 [Umbelopsis nana]
MTGKLCFWAILSTSDLRFIYFSPSLAKLLGIPPNIVPEVLQGKALWDFIHPEEYAMAKDDLKKFMETKNIGGSVTRCRLIDLDDIIEHKVIRRSSSEIDIPVKIQPRPLDRRRSSFNDGPNWEVVDIVMYLVTDQIILTFFHADYDVGLPTSAGSLPLVCQEVDFNIEDGKDLMALLHSITSGNAGITRSGSVRIFQIMETETKNVLVTWPPATDPCRESIQLSDATLSQLLVELIDKKALRHVDPKHLHPYENATCVHQAQVHRRVLLEYGPPKNVESIVVQYGSITFGSFDVCCLDTIVPSQTSSFDTSSSFSMSNNVQTPSPPTIANRLHRGAAITSDPDVRISLTDNELRNYATDEAVILTPILTEQLPKSAASSASVWNSNIQLNLGQPSPPVSNGRVTCESCHTESSPEWRKGPSGQKTLCNACGLRYARSVAKQDSFGRRQRGVRVVINNDPPYKYPKSPSNIQITNVSPRSKNRPSDQVVAEPLDHRPSYSEPVYPKPSSSSSSSSNRTKRRKKSRYLPIGDNRAGARTRAARKARMMQSDAPQF